MLSRVEEQIRRDLSRLLGRTITNAIFAAFVRRTAPIVLSGRGHLEDSAWLQYRTSLGVHEKPLDRAALVRFTEDTWHNSTNKVIGLDEPLDTTMADKIVRKADFWTRDAERGALIDYSLRDERLARWARVDEEPPTCPFCIVLISRGAVYHEPQPDFHTGDTCSVVLVAKGQENTFPGVQHRDAALAEYKRGVETAGPHSNLSGIVKAIEGLRSADAPATEGKNP